MFSRHRPLWRNKIEFVGIGRVRWYRGGVASWSTHPALSYRLCGSPFWIHPSGQPELSICMFPCQQQRHLESNPESDTRRVPELSFVVTGETGWLEALRFEFVCMDIRIDARRTFGSGHVYIYLCRVMCQELEKVEI